MKKNLFNKLLKENKNNLQKVVYMYCNNKIWLTNKQIDLLLKKRGNR